MSQKTLLWLTLEHLYWRQSLVYMMIKWTFIPSWSTPSLAPDGELLAGRKNRILWQMLQCPFFTKRGTTERKTLSQFDYAIPNIAQWGLAGHRAVILPKGLVLKWDYGLVWNKEEKGVDAQASRGAETLKHRRARYSQNKLFYLH